MPNWVKTKIIAKDTQAMKEHLLNDEGKVDFNKLIPMSKDLMISSGSDSYTTPSIFSGSLFDRSKEIKEQQAVDSIMAKYYDDTVSQDHFVGLCLLDKDYRKEVAKLKGIKFRGKDKTPVDRARETLETFAKGYFNYKRYGYKDWYDWSIMNWDTKWNADTNYVTDDEICISTAWSLPEKVLLELAKYTPIRVLYADEDMGVNCGMVDFFLDEDGNPTSKTILEESIELAYICWDYDYIPVYDDNWNEIEDLEDERVIEKNRNYESTWRLINSLMNKGSVEHDFVEA